MLFNSLHFYVFALIVIPAFFWFEKKGQKRLLLWASFYFYACLKIAFVPILLISFAATYLTSFKIESSISKSIKKFWLLLSLLVNLGILCFFKYTDFLRSISYDVRAFLGSNQNLTFEPIGLILPLGISFYTFQAIAYSIDIYRGQIKPEKSFSDFSLFLLFFPQLVAGPIMRASVLIPQIHTKKYFSKENLLAGLPIIALGIFKKTLIADPISDLISPLYSNPGEFHWFSLLLADYLFSIQIYCDFAGYSDIAIGTGKILGFDIPINFLRPFLSKSVTEVWQRWHISLSSWLRDYVYIPLGGNRVSKFRNYFNVFITMVIGGIWHGAAWTFVIWGTIHGIFITIEKYINEKGFGKIFSAIPKPIKILYSFQAFVIGAHFFRSTSVENSFLSAKRIFSMEGGVSVLPELSVLIPVAILFLLELSEEERWKILPQKQYSELLKYSIVAMIFLVAGMIYTVTVSPQFYYFQF
ncbi:MAG: MBOAT family protein [Leptospiraceae bacterium]|nr:MBOAT family protein [Leptospiraceae bacterium]MCK6382555.1 MBOAT family protein [Leptospiraceae bacterium]NUM42171.1 MBOAT family protein [Leptospiraceae bacterium]